MHGGIRMKITMSHAQFLEWKNSDKTTIDIKLENLGIKNVKDFEKQLVVSVGTALFLINNPSVAIDASNIDLSGIDNLGNTFLNIVRNVGYWIALISALTEIIKTSMRSGNNANEIGKIIMKYLLIYASLYLMPWLFDLVKEAF